MHEEMSETDLDDLYAQEKQKEEQGLYLEHSEPDIRELPEAEVKRLYKAGKLRGGDFDYAYHLFQNHDIPIQLQP